MPGGHARSAEHHPARRLAYACGMCTLIVLRRPDHAWPLLVAGNRDEMRDRPWAPPGRHWEDRPEVVAGLDELAGGSWFGINDQGVVAAVTNREGSLGPAPGSRSRGELVLEALDHADAREAAHALADLDPDAYRPFNLFVGDPVSAYWLRHPGDPDRIEVHEIPAGLHMLTAGDLDDWRIERVRLQLPRFRAAAEPHPLACDWRAWQALLSERAPDGHASPQSALNFTLPNGFGTLCSHLVAVPRYPGFTDKPRFLFADGPPDHVPFQDVAL